MKSYLEVRISAPEDLWELLLPALGELGSCGFLEEEENLTAYFPLSGDTVSDAGFRAELLRILRTFSANASVTLNEISDRNWNAAWERSLAPVEIGRRLVIKPSWTGYDNRSGRQIVLIDPKMSFGTGYHESTRLILELLEHHIRPGASVIDVGTGTGVLAIAAVLLGAAAAKGIDIDEWSLANGRENILQNNVADRVTISDRPLPSFGDGAADLVMANILRATLLDMLPEFHRILRPGGVLLLSGLLQNERTVMLEALARHGFQLREELAEHEWIAIGAGRS